MRRAPEPSLRASASSALTLAQQLAESEQHNLRLTKQLEPRHGQSATLGSAPARPLCLLGARLLAPCSSAPPGRGPATGTPATAFQWDPSSPPLVSQERKQSQMKFVQAVALTRSEKKVEVLEQELIDARETRRQLMKSL